MPIHWFQTLHSEQWCTGVVGPSRPQSCSQLRHLDAPGVIQANHPVALEDCRRHYLTDSGGHQDTPTKWSPDFQAMEFNDGKFEEELPYYSDSCPGHPVAPSGCFGCTAPKTEREESPYVNLKRLHLRMSLKLCLRVDRRLSWAVYPCNRSLARKDLRRGSGA